MHLAQLCSETMYFPCVTYETDGHNGFCHYNETHVTSCSPAMVSLSFMQFLTAISLDLNYTDNFFCYTKKYFTEPMHSCYQIATDLQIVHVVFTIPLDFRMCCMLYTVVVVCILLWEYLLLFVSEFLIFLSPP